MTLPIINSISTLIVALIAIFTLIEVYKQRKSSYKPELIIEHQNFKLIKYTEFEIPVIWMNRIEQFDIVSKNEANPMFSDEGFKIPVHNIGLGTAKNIQITFSTDLKKTINKINKLDVNKNIKIEFENSSFISFEPKKENYFLYKGITFNFQNEFKISIDYILPSQIEKEATNINVPMHYLYLCSILIYLWNKSETKDKGFIELPILNMLIEYRDIGNKRYKRKLSISFEISVTSVIATSGRTKINYA